MLNVIKLQSVVMLNVEYPYKHGEILESIFNLSNVEFCQMKTKGQCYKTFYGRKLRIFKISLHICPWQAFPA